MWLYVGEHLVCKASKADKLTLSREISKAAKRLRILLLLLVVAGMRRGWIIVARVDIPLLQDQSVYLTCSRTRSPPRPFLSAPVSPPGP